MRVRVREAFASRRLAGQTHLPFAHALAAHGVRFEFHVYYGDLHGTGLRNHPIDDAPQHPWGDALLRWLRLQSVLR